MLNIGIIGNGFVGKATYLLKCERINMFSYDINPELCIPKGITLSDICSCDIIFISVPTPMNEDGSCNTSIVESVVNSIKKYVNLDEKIVVIRSTIPVGVSDKLNCYFMPEFLTEKNYVSDFINNEEWIFGIKNTDQDINFEKLIIQLIDTSYEYGKIKTNKIIFVNNKEAEMIKLFKNTFLATKVSFCNEIYKYCEKKNINYDIVKDLVGNDTRIGNSHLSVPGHDGLFGYGGTCFPKDIHNLYSEMKKEKVDSYILKSVIERNELVDRSSKDWLNDKGRVIM